MIGKERWLESIFTIVVALFLNFSEQALAMDDSLDPPIQYQSQGASLIFLLRFSNIFSPFLTNGIS